MNSGPFLISFIGPYNQSARCFGLPPISSLLILEGEPSPCHSEGSLSTNHMRSFYLDSHPGSSNLPPTLYGS